MKNIPLLLGTIFGTLILVVAIGFMFSSSSQTTENDLIKVDPSIALGKARNVRILPLADASEGNKEDVVTIVEFSDFQCPACKASLPAIDQVLNEYPGKVRLVYRHFPLDSIHRNARKAAIASEAVASIDKEKFWDMHDLLFEKQSEWSNLRDKQELNDKFADYAAKLDIDRNEFLERIEDNSVIELVRNDSNTATQLGVNSTPSLYINGIKVSAPQLLSTVESLINSKEVEGK